MIYCFEVDITICNRSCIYLCEIVDRFSWRHVSPGGSSDITSHKADTTYSVLISDLRLRLG